MSIAIVGAGPCGLACARELERLGHHEWTLFERGDAAGGHAGSILDERGFTWDFGGHVVFSRIGEFDELLEEVLGDEFEEHERVSFVRIDGRWVPYPFQNNLRYLSPEAAYECLVGLIDAAGGDREMGFAAWLESTFGPGITERFMRPYNLKVWAMPLERMSSTWIAERVSVVDHRRALRSFVLEQDDVGWGPNNRFRFPRAGGTGEIYRRLAERFGARIRYGSEVAEVDPDRRSFRLTDGTRVEYDALVSTMPIDRLVARIACCPGEIASAARALAHNSVIVVGVGYEAPLEDRDCCWMYFPEDSTPFYRVTNFAKYAAANVPGGRTDRFSSYLTETAYSPHKAVRPEAVEEATLAGLEAVGLADPDAAVVSVHVADVEYAYPVPTLDRDEALVVIQRWLMERRIYSRGRFGSWRYELGNMDHAVKMGIDVARLLVEGRPEELWSG